MSIGLAQTSFFLKLSGFIKEVVGLTYSFSQILFKAVFQSVSLASTFYIHGALNNKVINTHKKFVTVKSHKNKNISREKTTNLLPNLVTGVVSIQIEHFYNTFYADNLNS